MTSNASIFRYFAVCSPGLEALLLEELNELGQDGDALKGGVAFQGPFESLWNVAHRSRIAESVRLRLKPFVAADFGKLIEQLLRLPFHAYLPAHRDYDVSVSCSESQLYHTSAVEERFREVIAKTWTRLGTDVCEDAPDDKLKFFIRIFRNQVTVSVDATGERLHRRGYRTHVGLAPIRETLAAACCRLLDKQVVPGPLQAIWDPCCGSGTLLCEWLRPKILVDSAQVATRRRSFAFESYPCHPKARYQDFLDQLISGEKAALGSTTIEAFGSDSDASALKAASNNLTQAGVHSRCTLIPLDLRDAVAQIPKGAAVLTNLPYGVRLTQARGTPRAFTLLDNVLRKRPDLRPAVAISTERPPRIGPSSWHPGCHFANGGLAVTAWILL